MTVTTLLPKSVDMKNHRLINAAAVYGRWKSGSTIDEESERIAKNNISFWKKSAATFSSDLIDIVLVENC